MASRHSAIASASFHGHGALSEVAVGLGIVGIEADGARYSAIASSNLP